MKLLRGRLQGLLFAAALIFGACAGHSPALAQTSSLSDNIVVEGATHGDADTIKGYFSGTDQGSVNRGIADLNATGMFSKVSAKAADGKVYVSVVEAGQVINRVAFEGNSKVKSDQLAVEVQSKSRTAYNESTAKGDVDRLKEAYKKLGRSDVKIDYRLVSLPNGRVDLVFKIDEGDKTGVKYINFVGNNAVSSYRLHGLMQTTEMNLLSFFKTSDVYNPDQLATDEESIRKYYMRYGYADFRITNTEVIYKPEEKGYVITISMEEGPQYHVSGVSVTSHISKVDSEELKRFVQIGAGDVYNASAIEKSVDSITRELARRGYAFSDVRPHGDRDNVAHTIGVAFTVDDGPKVYVERIDIVGNTRTRDYVIRREFDIGEGDPYNHALVERAEHRLNNLDFFKTVHISTRPGSSPDRIVITVNVEDKPTGSVGFSGGYSTTEGALAEVSFTETNFLGRGQYVKLSASEGQYSKGWNVTFTEPYFLDQRLAAGFDLFHKEQDKNQYALYQTWTTGVNLRLGIPVTDEITLQPNYSIYESKIVIPNTADQPYNDCSTWNPTGFAGGPGWVPTGGVMSAATANSNCLTNGEASIAIKAAAAQGTILTSLVGYSLIWDNVDNRKNPTSGAYLNFHQDVAGLGGQSRFVRETFDGRYYYPLTDDLVGLIHLQGGNINSLRGSLPIMDNFNLGPSLVRGFAPGGLGPRDISDPNNIASNGLGGTTYFGGSAEVQFPLFGLPRELGLKGALFTDAGTLFGFSAPRNYDALLGYHYCPTGGAIPLTQPSCLTVDDERRIRASAGASLLWASPLGPIRLDFALPILKGKNDQTQFFNFSGGASF